MYRELGGEIITVGSDAHRPEEAGADFKKFFTLLNELGYKYYCVFSKRNPEFIRLE
jgi:histidinol-phosphatase (PHP family)